MISYLALVKKKLCLIKRDVDLCKCACQNRKTAESWHMTLRQRYHFWDVSKRFLCSGVIEATCAFLPRLECVVPLTFHKLLVTVLMVVMICSDMSCGVA